MSAKWNVLYGIEGFGFGPRRLPDELSARQAVEKHKRLLRDANALELLLLPIGKKKERAMVEFLYGNAGATMDDLLRLWQELQPRSAEDPYTVEAVRKAIERVNRLFRDEPIPLEIVKARSTRDRYGKNRVWLDVRT